MGGKTNCGVLSYAYVDAEMADYVVAVTDCLVDYPNYPAEINQTKVDYVCVVDQIGIPEKIATGAAKPTTDQRKILMAEYCTQVVANTPYFKDGFSYQTGVGGASIASTISLSKIMEEKNIHMGLGVGGLTKPCASCWTAVWPASWWIRRTLTSTRSTMSAPTPTTSPSLLASTQAR